MHPRVYWDDEKTEQYTPQEIISWAADTYGDGLAMSSSFQQQSLALLHMVAVTAPSLPVFFINTGHHFVETLRYRDMVAERLGLNVIELQPEMTHEEQDAHYGTELWKHDPDLCCYLNKVLPMQNALRERTAWITGIRRDQSHQRARARVVECRDDGLVKINPLVTWAQKDVRRYVEFHRLPIHPLYRQGYRSVGCAPCTRPIASGESERAGRWSGRRKKECGLHTVFRVH